MKEYFKGQERLAMLVFSQLDNEKTGHDSSHIKRVLSLALRIAAKERKINHKILIASCLLHDISLSTGNIKKHEFESAERAKEILKNYPFNEKEIEQVYSIIQNHNRGFGEKNVRVEELSAEGKILCDADRLDGLGIIGIIRMIQFSTKQGVPLKTEKNRLDESVFGNLKYLSYLGNDLLTSEGKKLARDRNLQLSSFLKDLHKELFTTVK